MSTDKRSRKNIGSKSVLYAAFASMILANLACGLPIGGKPTEISQQATSSPTTIPLPTATQILLPPALVESDPPFDGELGLNEPITLFFNQPMDRAAVEVGLSGSNAQVLTYTWLDDAAVEVLPGDRLIPGADFSLTLDSTVRSSQGMAIAQPISLSFRSVDYLRLVQHLPKAGSQGVDPTSAIVASFNRPIAPLGVQSETLPQGFFIEPEVKGQGSWLNTSTFVFYPDPALSGGEVYTIRTNPELISTDGAPLDEAFSWSFQTAAPQLTRVEPDTEIPWPLNPEISLSFNQPMDLESVESNFGFVSPDGKQVDGEFTWLDENTKMVFTPKEILARNTVFNLVLDEEAKGVGESAINTAFSAQVVTVPEFMVVNSDPTQGGSVDPQNGLMVAFSAPLPGNKDLIRHISLTPTVSDLQASTDQNTLRLYGSFEANKDYVLTLESSMSDIWGGILGEDYQLSFKTNPFNPDIALITGTDAVFLTSQDASLVVQAINVAEIPLTVGEVPLQDLFQLLGSNGYELRQNYQGLNQVSYIQPLDLLPDKKQAVEVFLRADKQPLAPGIHFVRWDFPPMVDITSTRIYPGPYLIVVSDIQLTFKLSATDALIWAVDLRSGLPMASAQVILYAEGGQQIAVGRTDAQGLFHTTIEPRQDPYSQVYAVLGEPGTETFGMAFSSWTSGIEPWDFDIQIDQRPPGLYLYIYSDRPIYRPGDTVFFRVVAKNKFNGRYSPAEISSLPLSVFGADGRELMSLDLPLSTFGSAHGQIQLPDEAVPGYYSITSPQANNMYFGFQVADYRKPEIDLSIEFLHGEKRAGEDLNAKVSARFFFDAPAGNLKLNWALYQADKPFYLDRYQVGPEDLSWIEPYQLSNFGFGLGKMISQGEGETDPQGLYQLRLPTQPDETRQRYTLEVTVQDESGLPVSSRGSVLVNPDMVYIGLRPDTWVGKAGDQIGFEVKTADWAADPVEKIVLQAKFSKVTFEKVDPPPQDPFITPSFKLQPTVIGSTDFSTGAEGLARLAFTPPEPGTYMLDVINPASVNGARTQILIWVGGEGQTAWPKLPNSRLRLVADKEAYQAGETAEIFIPNPFDSPSRALLTLERSVVMDYQILEIEPGGNTLSLPITNETTPNLIVSVTLLGYDAEGDPDFRQGFVNISAEPEDQILNVTLQSEPQRAGPGDEVRFDILITDADGQPVQGEFSLAVVDMAALALADPNSEDIAAAFYGEQPSGVRTSLSLVAYHRRVFDIPPGMGGGGGDMAPAVVREEFPDTAYWSAEVITNEYGQASVTMKLPDSLTTWQVETRGLTADTRVGQARTEIVSTKELLVRPVTPRFLVAEDYVLLSAVVQNNAALDMQVQVGLQAVGFLLDDSAQAAQTVSLPAGGRRRLEWWGTVQEIEALNLVFSADGVGEDGGRYQDAARPAMGALPVLTYAAPQSFRTAGTLDAGGSVEELISLPRSYIPSGGDLEIELSPSLAAAMIGAFESLDGTPFNSSEQLLSSFLPNLETYQVLQTFGIQDASLETHLDQSIDKNLLRLLARQHYDGGWSWWDGGESDPYITAYVLFGLQRARAAGIAINQNAIDQAISYVQQSAAQQLQPDEGGIPAQNAGEILPEAAWQWDRQAFQQYVLAQFDSADPRIIEAVYQERGRLSPWAQALLVLALEGTEPDSQKASDLMVAVLGDAVRSAVGANWEFSQDEEGRRAAGYNMQNNLANTAIVLYTLAQRDPGSPLVTDVVRFLMASRSADGSWGSSYATAWALMALNQVLKGTGELGGNFEYQAALNGNQIASGTAGGVSQLSTVNTQVSIQNLYPDYPNLLKIEREDGVGRLYYSAGLKVFKPVDEAAPLSNGLTIGREIFPFGSGCQKDGCEPIQSAKAGDKVTVRLTLTVPHDLFYLAISDYIPAGAEILDPSLKTSQIGDGESDPEGVILYDPRRPFAQGWGWWLFSNAQIYDDHIAWTADSLPAGTYELTYTLVLLQPGIFRIIPARAWQLYAADVQGNSAGSVFEIKP